ncbi:putative NADH-flavin reductase [Actinocorallia herbida]|uniref:Putative NADH-flavin reductase n=1 Tax=Actinocorallia herbida TaxID=58109 RepID=A0A3N1D359_9ACTN|nr:SDR family oxidoreductase [Actinocorallia herbida]ROO87977.1 putative NADH-flavin reductase [Actinocorallia herbida]
MRVTVFGATGKIGRLVVDQLLAHGHHVVAFARDPSKVHRTDPHLTVITGQLSDTDAVGRAVTGSDAVVSALGPSLKRSTPAGPLAAGTRTIVDAMKAAGVRRIIGLATPSLADPRDARHWKHTVLPVMARLAFPNALTDLGRMTEAITGSGLDYTIARITNPTDKPGTGRIRAGYLGHDKIGSAMSRADIAAFLIGQLTDPRYSRSMPAISN